MDENITPKERVIKFTFNQKTVEHIFRIKQFVKNLTETCQYYNARFGSLSGREEAQLAPITSVCFTLSQKQLLVIKILLSSRLKSQKTQG